MTDLANANLPSSSPITMTRKMQGMEKASNRNLAERRCSRDVSAFALIVRSPMLGSFAQ